MPLPTSFVVKNGSKMRGRISGAMPAPVSALGMLAGSAMIAMGPALVDLLLLGGRFRAADTAQTAAYFTVFSLAVCFWAAQSIYSRAFYAAGNTMTPMVAGTVITLISLPMYAGLNRWHGAMGLAVASDVGIGMQTLVLAWLLHRKRMVSLASLDYKELGRCLLAGSVAGAVVWAAIAGSARVVPLHGRTLDGAELVVGGVLWLVLMDRLLDGLGSALPGVARKRLGLAG